MHIEKIEHGPEKEGFMSQVAFVLIIILWVAAAGITGLIFWKVFFSSPQVASGRAFVEDIGKLLAYLIFLLGGIIYLYVKELLQDEYVTTLE